METGILTIESIAMIDADDLSATDLRGAAIAGCIQDPIVDEERGETIAPAGTLLGAYLVHVADRAEAVQAVVLEIDGGRRIGIAWGSYADWGDLPDAPDWGSDAAHESVTDAILDYLNDADAWAARN